jgi:hypothetical protein
MDLLLAWLTPLLLALAIGELRNRALRSGLRSGLAATHPKRKQNASPARSSWSSWLHAHCPCCG